jgi:nucleoside-diphosphate-sugar epimerase
MTGATGFVGREVSNRLSDVGKEITVIGRSKPDADVPFLKCDITDDGELEAILRKKQFDCIVHFASLPGDTGNPREMVRTNVLGLQNLLEFAKESRAKRFVLASSISSYQWYPATKFVAPDYLPVDEKHPCRPKDMYSVTKRMQELLVGTYFHQYGVDGVALRLTAVIGPHGKGGGRSWRAFAEQLNRGIEVELPHFSREEICHYVDVRDVAEMVLAVIEHEGIGGEVFNCCGPEPIKGAEFEVAVKRLYPKIQVKYGYPWSMAQGQALYFEMEKAKKVLGFAPRYGVFDSLKSIKEWIDAGGLEEDVEERTFGGGLKS